MLRFSGLVLLDCTSNAFLPTDQMVLGFEASELEFAYNVASGSILYSETTVLMMQRGKSSPENPALM